MRKEWAQHQNEIKFIYRTEKSENEKGYKFIVYSFSLVPMPFLPPRFSAPAECYSHPPQICYKSFKEITIYEELI